MKEGQGMRRRDPYTRHSRHVTRTQRWKALRAEILSRDGHKCRSCGAFGRLEIDHIEAVRDAPGRAFDPNNLQALCPACHTRKTRLECGHKPLPEGRQKWRDSVLTLAREGKKNHRAHGESNA
jgi:5-methylcytosine-specific restriction enzyme A